MSNREKFKEWVSGNYNVRYPFNDIIDFFALSDEMGSDFLTMLNGKSSLVHGHQIHEIVDLENALIEKATVEDIQTLQTTKANVSHGHPISGITGLQAALDSKSTFSGSWADLTGKPSTFPATAHTHAISDTTNLQTELDGKIAKSPKASARANVNTGTSGLAVTVLGLSVISAAALTRLDEYGTAINDVLARLRSRDIIAT